MGRVGLRSERIVRRASLDLSAARSRRVVDFDGMDESRIVLRWLFWLCDRWEWLMGWRDIVLFCAGSLILATVESDTEEGRRTQ